VVRDREPPRVVVFDVGNVLIRWNPRNLYRKLFEDDERLEWFLAHVCDDAWNVEQDRGRSWADAVTERIARHPEWASHIRAFDERWQEMIAGPIEHNVVVLQRLRAAGVPTYAITNFSREKFAETCERFPFLGGFDGVVVSAHEGLLKPDPAIFRLFLARYGLAGGSCVFIDDSDDNVRGARAAGMRAIRFVEGLDLATALRGLGLPL
jgi:2-haloacid dehalogenase